MPISLGHFADLLTQLPSVKHVIDIVDLPPEPQKEKEIGESSNPKEKLSEIDRNLLFRT